MARSIDEVQFDSLPLHTHRSELDRDPPLSLEIHIIEGLRLDLTFFEGSRDLHEPISEGRFPMIDMGDDTKISDRFWFWHACIIEKKTKKAISFSEF